MKPHEGYQPPWWYQIALAAKYYGIHPESLMETPSLWVEVAAICADIEAHYREVHS